MSDVSNTHTNVHTPFVQRIRKEESLHRLILLRAYKILASWEWKPDGRACMLSFFHLSYVLHLVAVGALKTLVLLN